MYAVGIERDVAIQAEDGVALVADGFDVHIPRGYVYFAMAFAAIVEGFNILARQSRRRRSQ